MSSWRFSFFPRLIGGMAAHFRFGNIILHPSMVAIPHRKVHNFSIEEYCRIQRSERERSSGPRRCRLSPTRIARGVYRDWLCRTLGDSASLSSSGRVPDGGINRRCPVRRILSLERNHDAEGTRLNPDRRANGCDRSKRPLPILAEPYLFLHGLSSAGDRDLGQQPLVRWFGHRLRRTTHLGCDPPGRTLSRGEVRRGVRRVQKEGEAMGITADPPFTTRP